MKSRRHPNDHQQRLIGNLVDIVNLHHPLCELSQRVNWEDFETVFSGLYSTKGRPAKPIRLMVSLLMLKHIYDLSDEEVVWRWVENPYYQYFSGEEVFQWQVPCDPSELTYFRKRIGRSGVERILGESIRLHGEKAHEKVVVIDTTVQEKNITFPTDSKLYRKVIEQCWRIISAEGISVRQSYRRTVPKLLFHQRYRGHKSKAKLARASLRKLRTIAGRLLREIERKAPEAAAGRYQDILAICWRIVRQKRSDSKKLYSVHEPSVQCIAKGKEHKKYEFGSKVSIAVTAESGIIVGALNIAKNQYDGKTLDASLAQIERLGRAAPAVALVDEGFRGRQRVGSTAIERVHQMSYKNKASRRLRQQYRRWFRRRSSVEAIIGHLQQDHRLCRNYLKGRLGDDMNVVLAAAGFNLRKILRDILCLLIQCVSTFVGCRKPQIASKTG